MTSLEGFAGPLKIRKLVGEEGKTCEFPAKAYAVDKPAPGNRKTLKGQYQMDNAHSCDYILINDSNVLLLEDSNLGEKKKELERKYSGELSIRIIGKEQLLKAYASLLLLCKIASSDRAARRMIKDKAVNFCVVWNDVKLTDSRVFSQVKRQVEKPLKGIVSKVFVLSLTELESIIADYPKQ